MVTPLFLWCGVSGPTGALYLIDVMWLGAVGGGGAHWAPISHRCNVVGSVGKLWWAPTGAVISCRTSMSMLCPALGWRQWCALLQYHVAPFYPCPGPGLEAVLILVRSPVSLMITLRSSALSAAVATSSRGQGQWWMKGSHSITMKGVVVVVVVVGGGGCRP